MLIGIGVCVAASLLGLLAVKKPGWIRWSLAPIFLLCFWIGFRILYFAFGP